MGDDIHFTCPYCSKHLAIDSRAAGLMVPCPDCESLVGVPLLKARIVEDLVPKEPAVVEPPLCPNGHGPLRDWEGKPRCWTCGYPDAPPTLRERLARWFGR